MPHAFPSPAKRGKVPKADGGNHGCKLTNCSRIKRYTPLVRVMRAWNAALGIACLFAAIAEHEQVVEHESRADEGATGCDLGQIRIRADCKQ
jgi:hypothetical protein